MPDKLGSEQKQLEANLALLQLDGVDVDVLRNMIVGTPSREGELGVAEDSQTGDFNGMSFISNGNEIAVTGGKADVSGISGEISLQGYQYGRAIPDSGVTRLTFDDADTDSGTALDVWGNNDGTISGATTGVSGKYNEAYSFDGTDDYVSLGTDTFGSLNGDPISISVWFNYDGVSSGNLTIYSQEGAIVHRISEDNGAYEAYVTGTGSDSVSTSIPATGSWHHAVLTFDGSTQELYMNGSSVDSASASMFDLSSLTRDVKIGSQHDGSDPFPGDIDDPRVYSKALTATEVSNLYNTGSISG